MKEMLGAMVFQIFGLCGCAMYKITIDMKMRQIVFTEKLEMEFEEGRDSTHGRDECA